MSSETIEVQHFQLGNARIEIHADRKAAGDAAAQATAAAFRELGLTNQPFGVIFATGASQFDVLESLTTMKNLPWNQVIGFHMDEYVGISPEHPASFRRYLRERLKHKVEMKEFHEVNGSASDTAKARREYADMLAAAAPRICLLGIGENGHLAFNDPDVANFADPLQVKIVQLDPMCKRQQVAEGWFATESDVPNEAITLTIPALFQVPKLIVSVPGRRKAQIMRRTLKESISTECPSTILRTHPDVTIYLDQDSAAELEGLEILK